MNPFRTLEHLLPVAQIGTLEFPSKSVHEPVVHARPDVDEARKDFDELPIVSGDFLSAHFA